MATENETKICEACEQEIGKSETKCPNCGVEFEALEQEVGVIERALKVIKKRTAPTPAPDPAPTTPLKPKSIFRSLAGGKNA